MITSESEAVARRRARRMGDYGGDEERSGAIDVKSQVPRSRRREGKERMESRRMMAAQGPSETGVLGFQSRAGHWHSVRGLVEGGGWVGEARMSLLV